MRFGVRFGAASEPLHYTSLRSASLRVSSAVPLSPLHYASLRLLRSGVSPGPYEPPTLQVASLPSTPWSLRGEDGLGNKVDQEHAS